MSDFKWYRELRGGYWCLAPSGKWCRVTEILHKITMYYHPLTVNEVY